jgi:nucleotide-binding universal stress UspA family protein
VDVRRIVTGVNGSPCSLRALRYAAEMARFHDASLVPVLAWTPPGGELANRRYPCLELTRIWTRAAWDRLWQAVDLAIGGPPDDLGFWPQIVRGEPGRVLTQVARQPGDVLVIGAGRRGLLRALAAGRVSAYCLSHAACPVIALPPPQLASEAHGLRGWVSRHKLQPEDADLHVAGA